MYFPIGWPRILHSSAATGGRPVKVFRHRTRDAVVELRENSVAFWHSRLCILVASYRRSKECVEKHGVNTNAVIRADGSSLIIATSKGHLLFLRVLYERSSLPPTQPFYAVRDHGILINPSPNMEVFSDGNEAETISIKYLYETAVVGGIHSLFCLGNQLVVATGYGVLHRLNWEGKFNSSLAIHLNHVPIASDLLPDSRGQTLGEVEVCTKDVAYSPEVHGLSVVLSDGRAAFISAKSARYEPQSLQGVWMKDLTDAVCTAINSRYRLLAFGKENGAVDVFSVDDTTGVWSLSHTLQFTRRQFPDTGVQLGAVQSMEWSYEDAMVIAVSWKNGGLSLWSVFGTLLLCSLGDQPGTPSPLNPHFTVLESLCWSADGYHLWMLPTGAPSKLSVSSSFQRWSWGGESERGGATHSDGKRSSLTGSDGEGAGKPKEKLTPNRTNGGGERGGQVLVMNFLKNSIINNPIVSNHSHLFLQGSDRLYLNTSSRGEEAQSTSTAVGRGDNTMVSSPQWKVLQLPLSYLVLNWPIKYAAVNSSGTNLAVAGRAGFALFSNLRRKWKLFGNEIQEQSLVCRGGLLWFRDIVVFPCRVQEKFEEVRFYSLHSNLDNSQLLNSLRLTSPVIKLNLHGNHLLLASRDCHVTIYDLSTTVIPNKGLFLSVTKLHELSLAKSLSFPWAHTLISMVPSNIRTEPVTTKEGHWPIDSVLFNISGRLLMIQQSVPNPYLENQEEWSFSSPVALAPAVEAMWTPPCLPPGEGQSQQHLLQSLWLSCGSTGIKVWLPLYPRDEGHPSFLSKRIMLTLTISAYPQAILFQDAVLFGLSHETAFTETPLSTKQPFPFSMVERSAHIFLDHILRQLLRRNLGSHALQIARGCSHLPYFSHVLELMLHEILEEEAPGSMPVPDALLPRVVEFIKQFPEFLETVGSCARKTEVALWQYLFAAVGNPRDLFELCISDGHLKTAASYLIIIQNLEPSSVSRQLATRLLDAALDSNSWELCKDLVRFLRAIGPGEGIESPAHSITTPATPNPKTPLASATPTNVVGVTSPSPAMPPDLDRSAMSITRDHLSSGSASSIISFSGEYKDASGKVIRRPQFVMDVDSREEYFIELILSRHARKLLTACCLRDLGKFAAHLDFSLKTWLSRERLRAARLDDFVSTLRELHKQFQWPLPSTCQDDSQLESVRGTDHQESTPVPSHDHTDTFSPKDTATPTHAFSPEPHDNSDNVSVGSRRAKRPPDLDLSPAKNMEMTSEGGQCVTIEPQGAREEGTDDSKLRGPGGLVGDLDPTRDSTPTVQSGVARSTSVQVSLSLQRCPSSGELGTTSSLGDTMDNDWEVSSEVAITSGGPQTKRSAQAEREIRYFVEVALESLCVEWALILAVLLLDTSVFGRGVECVSTHAGVLDRDILTSCLQGVEELYEWAETDCPGYLPFMESVQLTVEQLHSLLQSSPETPAAAPVSSVTMEETHVGGVSADEQSGTLDERTPSQSDSEQSESACVIA